MPRRSTKRKRLHDVSTGEFLVKKYGSSISRGLDKGLTWAGNIASNIGSFLGMGDYEVSGNSLIKYGGDIAQEAVITPHGERAIRIKHKEYLGDIYTGAITGGPTTDFRSYTFPLNPGLAQTFPWLSSVALQYEQWSPDGIVFEFRSTASSYATNTMLGTVIMATDYDAYDTKYSTKQDMLNSAFSNERKLDTPRIVHGVECDPKDTPNRIFYVSNNLTSVSGSLREYSLGTFQIATQGTPVANANIGSLYVHYDIVLRKEQLFGGLPLRGQMAARYNWKSQSGGAKFWEQMYSGDMSHTAIYDTIGGTLEPIVNGAPNGDYLKYTFPTWINTGTYLVQCTWTTASYSSEIGASGGTIDFVNCKYGAAHFPFNMMANSGASGATFGTNGYTRTAIFSCCITVTGNQASFTMKPFFPIASLTGWSYTASFNMAQMNLTTFGGVA